MGPTKSLTFSRVFHKGCYVFLFVTCSLALLSGALMRTPFSTVQVSFFGGLPRGLEFAEPPQKAYK